MQDAEEAAKFDEDHVILEFTTTRLRREGMIC